MRDPNSFIVRKNGVISVDKSMDNFDAYLLDKASDELYYEGVEERVEFYLTRGALSIDYLSTQIAKTIPGSMKFSLKKKAVEKIIRQSSSKYRDTNKFILMPGEKHIMSQSYVKMALRK